MDHSLASYESLFWALILTVPRLLVATTLIPFLSRQTLPATMVKNGVIISFSLILLPTMQSFNVYEVGYIQTSFFLLKEMFIGLLLGFLAAIPFWAIEGVGFFIDNQRGATLAEILNPLTGSETSSMGILLNQAATAIFVTSGGLLGLLGLIYSSYVVWPILDPLPHLSLGKSLFFTSQLDFMMMLIVVLAAPVIITMFLSEFCFALVNRFAQQLNVFILAMPVKSAIALSILIVYLPSLFYFLDRYRQSFPETLRQLIHVLS